MIASDYHSQGGLEMRSESAMRRPRGGREEPALDPLRDPVVRELLDHIARELAEEYVRLMKAAARNSAPDGFEKEKP
jgi:hypothetical protein